MPTVTIKKPHFIWPPAPDKEELNDLIQQRINDISIKGKTGPIKQFEEDFLKYLDMGQKYAITFNSGTSALLAAYFALGIEENDEVIGPALTYHAVLSPVYLLKGNPVLVDVNKETRGIDPNKIQAAITKKTKAIVVVHQWGHPAHLDEILAVAKKNKLKVIEDCSHAHGSKYKGKKVGTFGDIAIFSLQAAKMLYAGEGGILVTSNEEYHNRATLLGHYRDRSREEIKDPFYQQFWVTGYGQKLRISPFDAIIAIHALRKLDKRIVSRKKCLVYFMKGLQQIPEVEVPYIAKWADMGAWYGFKPVVKLDKLNGHSRDEYVKMLQEEGVDVTIPSAPVLADLPLYNIKKDKMYKRKNKRIFNSSDYPIAQYFTNTALSLETFTDWKVSKPIIDQYIQAFKVVSKRINR